MNKILPVLDDDLRVINLGLGLFADDLEEAGAQVVRMDWRPPSGGNARLASILAQLDD